MPAGVTHAVDSFLTWWTKGGQRSVKMKDRLRIPFVAVQPFDPIQLAVVGQSDSARSLTCEGTTDACDANIICLNSRCVDASTALGADTIRQTQPAGRGNEQQPPTDV